MKFGEKLKILRKEKKLSQEELAKAVGLSRRAYIAYELEGAYPRHREVYSRLAEVLGCEVNYLLAEDEQFIMDAAEKYGLSGRQQAQELVRQLSGLFAGGELSDADRDAVMIALQKAYFDCKEDNKKYGKKSSKDE